MTLFLNHTPPPHVFWNMKWEGETKFVFYIFIFRYEIFYNVQYIWSGRRFVSKRFAWCPFKNFCLRRASTTLTIKWRAPAGTVPVAGIPFTKFYLIFTANSTVQIGHKWEFRTILWTLHLKICLRRHFTWTVVLPWNALRLASRCFLESHKKKFACGAVLHENGKRGEQQEKKEKRSFIYVHVQSERWSNARERGRSPSARPEGALRFFRSCPLYV